jgi:simple sugar transport system substrate-binding protein
MKERLVVVLAVGALVLGGLFNVFCVAAEGAKKPVIAVVVKSIAYRWFQRMQEGVLQFAKDYDVVAFLQGPPVADSAQQVMLIEQLIAMGVDAIVNVPYGVPENEPAQKAAMDAGIIVITHEASTTRYAHYDLEAFDNKSYGEEMMRRLAELMGYEGDYVQFVGSFTNASHMEWQLAAKAYQEAHYPKMRSLGIFESKETEAYTVFKDLLKAYPTIRGVLGSSALDVVGAGQVIQEAGLNDQIAVVGTSIVSYAGELLKTGAVDIAMCWDPALAGYAACVVAYKLLKGEEIKDGMNLGVPGYENIRIVVNEYGVPIIYGTGWIIITKDNMHLYNF